MGATPLPLPNLRTVKYRQRPARMGRELTRPPVFRRPQPTQAPPMTDADQLRLARSLQFRELLVALFDDPTPWGESVPMQALADHLEQDGRRDLADVVRGRFQVGSSQLQVVQHWRNVDTEPQFPHADMGHLRNRRNMRSVTHVVELMGTMPFGENEA